MPARAAPPLAPEAVVELRGPGGVLVRWFCTPEHLDELAAGWLVGQGHAARPDDIGRLDVDAASGAVHVAGFAGPLRDPPDPPPARKPRTVAFIETLIETPDALRGSFEAMFERGALRRISGGVHTGALLVDAELLVVREDVSRHCVVDKLIGRAVLDGTPLERGLILLSGRISGALAAKGARVGLAAMATISIPTTLAAGIAARAGITLIGRARSASPHVYRPGA